MGSVKRNRTLGTCVTITKGREEKEDGAKKIPEEIMTKNFLNLAEDINQQF